jgi:Serine phosphatase RsbU, regulator of sigma subunit
MAIRENTTLMREIIEKMEYMVRVMDADHKVIYMNKKMRDEFGHTMGHICYDLLDQCEKCEHCVTIGSKQSGKPDMKNVPIGDKFYNIMSSPVNAQDGTNYSIEFLHDITDQKKTEDELMKHYEKLKADIEFAKHIQKCTLPIDGVYYDAVELNSVYQPSEDLGGDLFDMIKLDNRKSLIYISDVSGHGIKSSLLTIFLRQIVRGRTFESKPTLRRIVEVLLSSYLDLGIGDEQYLSVLFCCYDKENKEISFLNAGHNCLPILIHQNGEIEEIFVQGLPICKLVEKPNHEQVVVKVESGDRILLYTDGITETYNKTKVPYGTEGIIKTIKNNFGLDGKDLVRTILAEVQEYADTTQIDDIAIVVAKIL